MATLQDLRAVGMAAVHLPDALLRRGCGTIQHVAESNARHPVLLVHGYAATESVWTPLRGALAEAGFGHVVSLTYNSFMTDPEAVSSELTQQAPRALAAAGAPRVHRRRPRAGGRLMRTAAGRDHDYPLVSSPAQTPAPGPWLNVSRHCSAGV
jgi:hypothetical protein